jgi:hypothetical protein
VPKIDAKFDPGFVWGGLRVALDVSGFFFGLNGIESV